LFPPYTTELNLTNALNCCCCFLASSSIATPNSNTQPTTFTNEYHLHSPRSQKSEKGCSPASPLAEPRSHLKQKWLLPPSYALRLLLLTQPAPRSKTLLSNSCKVVPEGSTTLPQQVRRGVKFLPRTLGTLATHTDDSREVLKIARGGISVTDRDSLRL